LRQAVRRLGVELGEHAVVQRREPPPLRGLREMLQGPPLSGRRGWMVTDPDSGQSVALWKLDNHLFAAWLTFSNSSPVLTHHAIYWNGRYGLDLSDQPREDLLMRGYDRLKLDGDQRRKWDYFFPPLTEHLPHHRLLARRQVTGQAVEEWVILERIRAAAAVAVGAGLVFFAAVPWMVAALVCGGVVLLMRHSAHHLRLGPPDPAAGPRDFFRDVRAVLAPGGGVKIHERALLNHRRPPPGPPPPARTLGRALLDDVRAFSRLTSTFLPAVLLAAAIAGSRLLLHAPHPLPYALAVLLLALLASDEANGWWVLHRLRNGGGERTAPGWVVAALAAVVGASLPLVVGFVVLAAGKLIRTLLLVRLRAALDTEQGYLEEELDVLLSQVPDDVPSDEEIDAWLDADLAVLDRRSVEELHLDPACLLPVEGRLLQKLPVVPAEMAALDAGRVPAAVRQAATGYGVHLGDQAEVLRSGRQWALVNGNAEYTLTRKGDALHLYEGEDLNPRGLHGIPILSWGLLQPPEAFGKNKLLGEQPERLWAYDVGRDRRLRHAVYYVQFIYFADQMLAGSGFFYDFIQGVRGGRGRPSNAEYPYFHVVGVEDHPVPNDKLQEMQLGKLETTLFALQVVNGNTICVVLTDESVLKRVKEKLRQAPRRKAGNASEELVDGASTPSSQPRSILEAKEEETDAARSKTLINYVKSQWRDRRARASH
jgi:hypothetical protein